MTVTLVAAVARNGVIGLDGGLPWHIPGDLPRFKAMTLGHVLVMGRKTYESIGRPLPDRTTIVVTRQPDWHDDARVLIAHSVDEALARAGALDEKVFVVGGAQIYAEALPLADRLELTHVDLEPDGDTVFPPVDWSDWRVVCREPGEGCEYVSYERAQG